MQNSFAAFQLPNYWNILSDIDRYQYCVLRAQMQAQTSKNQRNKRVENFTETLEAVKRFCCRGDGEDWRRFLVCGVCWLPEGIAINTRQLRILIYKCKSSINGSLHKMGFNVNLGRTEAANALIMAIPMLKDNTLELRQWTVRQAPPSCLSPISPPILSPVCSQKPFEVPMINLTNLQNQQIQQPIQKQCPSPVQKQPLPIPYINQVFAKPVEFQETLSEESYEPDYPHHDDFDDLSIEQPMLLDDYWN